ncbi:PIG-L family deacetylase [Pedobacter cryophilus]|uniref:PIG-L family deacetylase n=1 Tax=Pedobacter cryophilus TaxID=2571271 RepID=A0A4U1C672_9SPHI|nr:PIG-L family deacetylase [Pedobacter cryophilus]TKC00872.1 PIG-L family deacetylase [Pedobacter cryophilus]
MKLRILTVVFLLVSIFTQAQTSPQLNAAEILQSIKKLNVTGSVLYIAAHPDDENTRLLSYLAKEKLYKTAYLSITRGDGGQNLIGNEQSEDLGLIRTQELLAARRNDGAQQFFTRANDFGFSKTAEETFKIWNKDSILSDVVYLIRKFRPDVIITRFPPDERAGHGHHAASSILAQEAFSAAADPRKFPEQLKEVQVWQAHRILWNNYNFGDNNNTAPDQFKVDVGVYNPLLGKGYGEIAAESRSMHKSQGFGSSKQRGSSLEYFSEWKGGLPQTDLMEGVKVGWDKLEGAEEIAKQISAVQNNFQPQKPEKSISALLNIYTALSGMSKTNSLVNEKLEEVKTLLLACSGTWFEAYAQSASIAVNTPLKVRIDAITRQKGIVISSSLKKNEEELSINKIVSFEGTQTMTSTSQPYWLNEAHEIGRYQIGRRDNLNYPEGKTVSFVNFDVSINGVNLSFERPIVYKYTDQVRGEIYQPLAITPPVTANLEAKAFLFNNADAKNVTIKLKAFKDNTSGTASLSLPTGWVASPAKIPFDLKKYGEETSLTFSVSPSAQAKNGQLKVNLAIADKTYHQGIKVISYEHIPTITYFPEAEAKLVKLDLKTAGKNIGYIAGAGDLVPDMLKEIGFKVTMLSENEIMSGDLSKYDAIIAGVRAYNVNERLKFEQNKLMKYVENGGVYVVQYNVNRPLVLDQIGPYPFSITRDRVTEEDAEIKLALPESKVLNYPNKITAKDFEGWIQERGIYFANTTSPQYEKPLSMKDTGEKATDGALLVANYGKGKFVYTGLVFFRELPAGVPGAYRLFVNLISK